MAFPKKRNDKYYPQTGTKSTGIKHNTDSILITCVRSIPERVAAAIRFCLLPTTTYLDILHFIEANDPSVISKPTTSDESEETNKVLS